ncbi:ATP-grasp domain-containing protein [Salinirubellus salinus]|uniref:ATP-grasp domain-containing protein n=1 Tax=Salinirubellus salinus TaxID=1364945 RepID=A0A9E7R286_9EURY|nr:ATP-grasp domain-containing protein [Salinirubellus salinus]UWM53305.1 ATP-grasp domain-containing protein [Salinirubellus salinus]
MSEAFSADRTDGQVPPTGVRVGVLSFHNSKETKAILNAVRALGHEPVWLREENTRTWTADGRVHFDPDVDVVANRLLTTKASHPLDDLGVAASYDAARPVLNAPDAVLRAVHKYGAAATLAAAGLPVPDAYMAFAHRTINEDAPVDGRTVHKPAIGTNGGRMTVVEADEAVAPTVARRRAFLQQFFDAGEGRPFDVRVYVVDDRVVGAMKRYAPAGEWRTNVALGGEVKDFTDDLPAEASDLARDATAVLGLDYAGVDLLQRDGEWYVLEVNATAGFKGLFEATGVSPAPAIARLAIERAEGRVDDDRVAELVTTLDDSVPECRPAPAAAPTAPETVGYTESVVVSGGGALEHAVAKADTGARRTSIDVDLAAAVGAGPLVGTTRVRSGTTQSGTKRPLVDLSVKVGGRWHTTTASVEDRSHMRYPVLLGRDVLRGYHVDVQRRVDEE